jgi:hypothetical protein
VSTPVDGKVDLKCVIVGVDDLQAGKQWERPYLGHVVAVFPQGLDAGCHRVLELVGAQCWAGE